EKGAWAAWSGDGRYLYFADSLPTEETSSSHLLKISAQGGSPVVIRNDPGTGPAPAFDGSGLYYIVATENLTGGLDFELRAAKPETAPSRTLVRISSIRAPQWQGLHPTLSHSGEWLAVALNDDYGTDIWLVSTA